ncbi:hypothetical protein L6452_13422 [Arctium lappa]|uniref:Uncharacterized protein n=1 Tax=Arctium lappa TaxID=4217 RepID=A0ACB9CI79_ARCLA|nr:hypothetical protein L6452_13422 [Arctium lappa]
MIFTSLQLVRHLAKIVLGPSSILHHHGLSFLVAEACLIAGAKKNAYHTKYKGAVFVVATMILNVYYYMYFTKATTQPAHKTSRSSSTVGMTGYA